MADASERGEYACDTSQVPVGGRVIEQLGRTSVGVFNIAGEYLAIRNYCPHAGAPICEGALTGAIVSEAAFDRHMAHDGCVLKCPWHGWEFMLPQGVTITEPQLRLRRYPLAVHDGMIFVQTRPGRLPAPAAQAMAAS